jgi:hypothetical protein
MYMAKLDVLDKIETGWNAFIGLVESFPLEDRVRPDAVGHWNIHETLIHIAAWDNETLLLVKGFEANGAKPGWLNQSGDDLNALNESHVTARRDLDSALIWTHFRDTHQELVDFLETCDEHVFVDGSFTGGMLTETWKHYQGHGQDLTNFKESLK